MSNLTDFFGGNGRTRKFVVLTTGTSWAVPANLVEGLVSVTMIGGGQACSGTSSGYGGGGGSVITENLMAVTAGASVSYVIGAAAGGKTGARGGATVFNTIFKAEGGGASTVGAAVSPSNYVGPPGLDIPLTSTLNKTPLPGAGKYGCYGRGYGFQTGAGGIMIYGSVYGTGGLLTSSTAADAQARPGVIYLQWVEQIA